VVAPKGPSRLTRIIRVFWLPTQPVPPEGTPERLAYDALQKAARESGAIWKTG
jgi:hypothetical protein